MHGRPRIADDPVRQRPTERRPQRQAAAGPELRADARSRPGRPRARRDDVAEAAKRDHAGRRDKADAVTWFDGTSFATSAAFSPDVCRSCSSSRASSPVERDLGKTWERLLPRTAYKYADDAEGEKPQKGWTRVFPHALGDVRRRHPTSSTANGRRVHSRTSTSSRWRRRRSTACALGQGTTTDYLGVSFSALDSVGHKFGPRSHEVQDLLARLDVTVGRLLDHLDARVGRGKYVVACPRITAWRSSQSN